MPKGPFLPSQARKHSEEVQAILNKTRKFDFDHSLAPHMTDERNKLDL